MHGHPLEQHLRGHAWPSSRATSTGACTAIHWGNIYRGMHGHPLGQCLWGLPLVPYSMCANRECSCVTVHRPLWLKPLIFRALNRSSSHHYGFEPSSGHMWDKLSSACRWSGGFSWGSPVFAPPTDWLGSQWVKSSWRAENPVKKKQACLSLRLFEKWLFQMG